MCTTLLVAGVLAACSGGGGGGSEAPPPVTPNAFLELFAGSLGGAGSVDGPLAVARFNAPGGLARDVTGAIYVADTGNHSIRRISADGVVSTLAGRSGTNGYMNGAPAEARFDSPRAITVDASGTVYVADTNNSAIRRITPTGLTTTLLENIHANGLAIDAQGNVLASEQHSIVRIAPSGQKTVVAGVPGECGSVDGPRETARLCTPTGLEADDAGNIYFVGLDHTLRRVGPAGDVTTLAGLAQQPGAGDGIGPEARFEFPWGIVRDASTGVLYVTSNHAIRRVTPAGEVTTVAGRAGETGSANGAGDSARFYYLWDLVRLPNGDLLAADSLNYGVRRITSTGVVTTFAGTPPAGTVIAREVAIAPEGTLYGTTGRAIHRFAADGSVTRVAGDESAPGGQMDGMGSAARFDRLTGIAVDASGNIFVTDVTSPSFPFAGVTTKIPPPVYYGTVRRVTPAGEVTTVAGSPSEGGTVDGVGRAARFRNLSGITVDAGGNIFVTDIEARTVRRITPAGVVTTVAGADFQIDHVDAAGSAARFAGPEDVAVDAQGNLFVTDMHNTSIRRITPEGVVTTLAGASRVPARTVDGVGAAARFSFPHGIEIDAAGNLYVSEVGGHVVRKVTPAGAVTTVVGVPGAVGFVPGPLPGALQYPMGLALRNRDLFIAMDTAVAVVRNLP